MKQEAQGTHAYRRRRKATSSPRLSISWDKLLTEMFSGTTLDSFKRRPKIAWGVLLLSLPHDPAINILHGLKHLSVPLYLQNICLI